MSKHPKNRRIDYSVEEMCELTGRSKSSFIQALKKIEKSYNIDEKEFKCVKEFKGSTFLFGPDTAYLIALLMKGLEKHPIYRTNPDANKISALDYQEYNRTLIDYIEKTEDFPENLKKALYASEYFYTSELIAEWTKTLIEEILIYIVGVVNSKHGGNVGTVLGRAARSLNDLNFKLFESEYMVKLNYILGAEDYSKMLNRQVEPEEFTAEHNNNVCLDKAVVGLLKISLKKADEARENDLMQYIDYLKEIMPEEKEFLEDECFKQGSPFIERDLYFKIEWPDLEYDYKYKHNTEKLIEPARKARKKWKERELYSNYYELSIDERIIERQKTIETYKLEIAEREKLIKEQEEIIEELKNSSEEELKKSGEVATELLNGIVKNYQKYREQNLKESKKIYEKTDLYHIVDNSLGRVLAAFTENDNIS